MDELPDDILSEIFRRLNVQTLIKLELVSRRWRSVAKSSWTNDVTREFNIAKYFRNNKLARARRANMLCRVGPFLESFIFLPSSNLVVKWRYDVLRFAEQYDLSAIKRVQIDKCTSESASVYFCTKLMSEFLGQFHGTRELVLFGCFCGHDSPGSFLPRQPHDALHSVSGMPFLNALFIGADVHLTSRDFRVFTHLAPKLRSFHVGLQPHFCNVIDAVKELRKLRELSIETDNLCCKAVAEKGLNVIVQGCPDLTKVMLYNKAATGFYAAAAAVLITLTKLELLWINGKFFLPKIATKDDLAKAEERLAFSWSRKLLKKRNDSFESQCTLFAYDFESENGVSYGVAPIPGNQ